MYITSPVQPILTAKGATGIGNPIPVKDYKHIVLLFSTDGSANATVKIQGSCKETVPDFAAAQATDNHWDYVAVNDLQDASKINGDTGIVVAGTDDIRTLLVNTDGISWINANITARSAGNVTLKLVGYNNG